MKTVKIHFLPENVTTSAQVGESWLNVAARAGVHISTGCMAGACHACEIILVTKIAVTEIAATEIANAIATNAVTTDNAAQPEIAQAMQKKEPEEKNEEEPEEEPVLACLQGVPDGFEHIEVTLLDDPTW
jgi:ferredoxin